MHTKVEVNFSVVKIPVSPGTTLQVPPEPPAVVKLTLRPGFSQQSVLETVCEQKSLNPATCGLK